MLQKGKKMLLIGKPSPMKCAIIYVYIYIVKKRLPHIFSAVSLRTERSGVRQSREKNIRNDILTMVTTVQNSHLAVCYIKIFDQRRIKKMKKNYVTFQLNTVTFEETDVIRTSINAATQMVEQDVDYESYFA
jgi:hypothetical protein